MDVVVASVGGVEMIEADLLGARLLPRGDCRHDGVGTMFLVVADEAEVISEGRRYPLPAGSYAVLPDRAEVHGACGLAVIDRRHRGLFMVGGRVESRGRLRYIDGCSDTVLVPPVVRGDPCLNLLHVPRGVVQTDHEHPTTRVGLVLEGRGRCVAAGRTYEDLVPGVAFVLPPHVVHRFETPDDEMLLAAWHPDSDMGPCDDDHPMLNRTVLRDGQDRRPS